MSFISFLDRQEILEALLRNWSVTARAPELGQGPDQSLEGEGMRKEEAKEEGEDDDNISAQQIR